jgi:hypothetical protein
MRGRSMDSIPSGNLITIQLYRRIREKEKFIIFTTALVYMIVLAILIKYR